MFPWVRNIGSDNGLAPRYNLIHGNAFLKFGMQIGAGLHVLNRNDDKNHDNSRDIVNEQEMLLA